MVLNNNIEKLLEKYNNGETTIKEEKHLKNYFSKENVAPHLEKYKPLFEYFFINQQEKFTKDVSLTTNKKNNYKWLSVAAVVILMFGIYFNSNSISQEELGTYNEQEKELALNEFKQSLKLVSNAFTKGTLQVSYLRQLEKASVPIVYLEDMNEPLNRIFKN